MSHGGRPLLNVAVVLYGFFVQWSRVLVAGAAATLAFRPRNSPHRSKATRLFLIHAPPLPTTVRFRR